MFCLLDFRGDLQWNAGEKKLTGGANWQPKVTPATWSAGVPPSAPLVCSQQRSGPCWAFAIRVPYVYFDTDTFTSSLKKYKQDAKFTKMFHWL